MTKRLLFSTSIQHLGRIFFLLLFSSGFAQTVYYADSVNGNDANSGLAGFPKKTFTSVFAAAPAGSIIDLTGTFTWSDVSETTAAISGFTISKNMTIRGQGADQTIIQANALPNVANRRVFTINSGVSVVLEKLTIQNGKVANLDNTVSPADGGGVYNSGTLTLNYCRISQNYAIAGSSYSGGSGGGIMHTSNNTMNINGCTFDNNQANSGGALVNNFNNASGSFIITNSTFAYNKQLALVATVGGGAIWILNGINIITNCTFSYNDLNNSNGSGTGDGASILIRQGNVKLKNDIFVNGTRSGQLFASGKSEIAFAGGSATDEGNNIFGTQTGITFNSTSWVPSTGGGYQNVGDATKKCLLNVDSVLGINGATNGIVSLRTTGLNIEGGSTVANNGVNIPTIDQRGITRVGTPDIGAYEYTDLTPFVSCFSPTTGTTGTSISISGINFTGATSVKLNGVEATSFSVNSNSSITAIAPQSTTGLIAVTTNQGTGNSSSNYVYVPTLQTTTLSAFSKCTGSPSLSQTFTVSGSNLTSNLVVAAYTNLEYSLDGTSYTSTLSFTPVAETVASTTVYVRMTSASTSLTSGNISISSTGATTKTIAVSGVVNSVPSITTGAINYVGQSATSFTIPYTAIANSPTLYSVSSGTNALSGFTPIVDASFSGATGNLSVTIPANSTPGTYDFNITVKNGTTGCVSIISSKTATILPPIPTITSFTPINGAVGSTVTITGIGFNTTAANNVVRLNGMKCTVTAATATQLTLTVPAGTGHGKFLVTNLGTNLSAYSNNKFIVLSNYSNQTIDNTAFVKNNLTASFSTTAPTVQRTHLVGDYNDDGKMDIAYYTTGGILNIYKNNASSGSLTSSSFTQTTINLPFSGFYTNNGTMLTTELNGDGKLDLAVTDGGYNGGFANINNSTSGTLAFNSASDIRSSNAQYNVTSGFEPYDVNSDGKIDFVGFYNANWLYNSVNTTTGTTFSVATGNTANSYAYSASSISPLPSVTESFDVDQDGKQDLVFGYSTGVAVSRNITAANANQLNFTYSNTTIATGLSTVNTINTADFNKDGKLDVIVSEGSNLRIYLNTSTSGSVLFSSATTITLSTAQGVGLGDLDGDGNIDIIASDNTGTYFIKNTTNQGASVSTFATKILINSQASITDLNVIDFDNDGKLDVVGNNYYTFYLLRNQIGELPAITVSSTALNTISNCKTPRVITDHSAVGTDIVITSSDLVYLNSYGNPLLVYKNAADGNYYGSYLYTTVGTGISGASATSLNNLMTTYSGIKALAGNFPSANPQITFDQTTGIVSGAIAVLPYYENYTVSGVNLTANLTITPPANFQVSTDQTTWIGTTTTPTAITLTPSSGTVATATVYVRTIPALATGSYSGTNITMASTGATSVTKAVGATLYAPTAIGTQPSTTKNICINASTGNTINVVATGSGLTYQWYSNTTNSTTGGTNLGATSGAQTATVTLATATAGTTYYYCVVSGSCGTVTSSVSAVTISPASVAGTASAAATTICSGTTTTLSLTGNTGTIQWQSSLNNSTWTDISGATSASYTTSALTKTTYYRANVTSGACTAGATSAITVTVPAAPYPYDRAVNFASTGYLTKATTSSLGLTNFTVEAWIYPTAFNNYAGIVAKQDFQLMTATNGALAFMIERSWSWELRTSATNVLTLNKWQHVAASYNASTKQMKMYVDGVLVDTYTRTQSFVPDFTTANLTVGYNNGTGNGSPSRNFAGNIDEVKVWNAVKTDAEISINYATQLVGNETALVAYYKFDQGIGSGNNTAITSLTDLTANANHLTLSSMTMNGATNNIIQVGPAILSTPTICLNTTATLTHTDIGGTWSTSDANVISIDPSTGAATANALGTATITYTFTFNGCTFSSTKLFTVLDIPAITTQPVTTAQNVCINGTTTALSVTATGAGLNYQWYKNTTSANTGGTAITGATSASYTPLATTAGDAYYYCVVSGTCSPSVTSNVSGLIKIYPVSVAGTIASSVASICDSGATTLTLSGATGNIQWQRFDNPVWTDLTGETNTTFTTPTLTQNTIYRAQLTSGPCSSVTTSNFTVTVNVSPAAPTAITTVNYCQGATATALSATPTSGYSLQWYTVATGGTASTTAPTPTTTAVGATTYYVSQKAIPTNVSLSTTSGTTQSYTAIGTGTTFGQTFTLTSNTSLTSITLGTFFYGGSTVMKIYNGFGGSLIATSSNTVTLSSTGYYYNPVFNFTNTLLNANQTYYFEITSTAVTYVMDPKSNIITGNAYNGTTPYTNLDLTFTLAGTSISSPCESPRTAITVNVNAIPTISGVQNMTLGGSSLQLTGSGTPDTTTPWASSNTAVATVSTTGEVTAVAGGTTTITYTTSSGCSITATIRVIDCAQPFGNALAFGVGTTAASADYVQVNSRIFPSQTVANFTIETWIKPAAADIISGTPGTNWLAFLGYTGTKRSPSIYITNNGVLHASWNEGATFIGTPVSASSPTSLIQDKWAHVALVKDGTTMRLYVNGVQITSVACSATIDIPDNAYWLGKSDQQFSGALDEVRFWSTARTQNQIQTSMNTELIGNESGLLAYFDFNQGIAGGTNTATTTLTNKANNTLNGTLTNFTKTGTTSNFVGSTISNMDITGATNICANSTSQYTHPVAGGIWSVSSGANATVSSTGLVTSATNENITLSYTYTMNGCSFTATKAAIINTPAVPVTTTTVNLCQGVTATALTATTTTGNTLQWYTVVSGGVASTTAPIPSTTTLGAVTYYVGQKNNTTSCESPRAAITVNTNAIPTILGAQNMTVGGSTLQLTGTGTPDATTPWTSSNTAVATISAIGEVTAVALGTTTITYTSSGGCTTTTTIKVLDCTQPFGNALNFDGVNDYVVLDNVGSNTSLQFANTTNYTLEAWVKRTAATSGNASIIAKQNGNVAGNYSLGISSTGVPYLSREYTPWAVNATSSLSLNEWHHIAGVFDGSSLKIYIDGVLSNSVTASGSITPSNVTAIKVAIGAMYTNSSPSNFFNGSIDEARIWNVARTATQIQQAKDSALNGNETGLVAYYNFNQGVAEGNNTAVTSIANPVNSTSNGALTNFTKTGTTSNFVGSVYNLDISGASSICASTTSQYTHPISGGTWSVSNGANASVSSTGLLTSSGAENVTLSYAYTLNGCSFTATKTVAIIVASITVQPSTVSQTLCLNAAATALTVTATNVTTTYQWYKTTTATNTGGTAITGATNASYSPLTNVAGTTYYYCVVSGTCTPSVTSAVSGAIVVSPASVAGTISGTNSICTGVTSTLTLTGSIGIIQWQRYDSPIWTDLTGETNTTFTTPALTQNTTYRATVISGYCSGISTGNYTITVNQLPVISGLTSVGTGDNITLTATTTAATNNPWISSNPTVATVSNTGVVSGLTTGTTMITFTNNNGCTATTMITVNLGTTQPPVLNSPLIGTAGSTTLNFNYSLPEAPLVGSVKLIFTPTAGGTPIVWTMSNTMSVIFNYVVGTAPTSILNVVSGTALEFTTYDVTLAYQDAFRNPVASTTNTGVGTLALPSISFAQSNYTGLVNVAIATIVPTNTGAAISRYSITPALPNGLVFNTTTGSISGIPLETKAVTNYTITATNAAGSDVKIISVMIDGDSDRDGVPDSVEIQQGTNPNVAGALDTDGDGVPDYIEVQQGTNPNVPGALDTDGDGVPDYIEVQQGTNPSVLGALDTDGDGVPDYIEMQQGTNPNVLGAKDTDGDGVPDYVELQQGTNLNLPGALDTDGDGVPDYIEVQQGTNPNVPGAKDTDGDGVPDYIEVQQGTNPNVPGALDTDGDGVPDYIEVQQGTNPNVPGALDTDGDGVPDYIEVQQGTNPNVPGAKDTDGDGVPDYIEMQQGTNPNVPGAKDTDGDGVPDYIEVQQGTNPNVPGALDTDSDGVPDYIEVQQGTNPNVPGAKDTDGDGVPDYIEMQQGTNPNVPGAKDTDGDGIPDYIEVQQGTNPNQAGDALDTDGDGVPDYIEVQQGTNPNVPGAKDTDGDGVPDYIEVQQGTNPNVPGAKDTDGDGVPDYIEVQQGTNPSVPGDILIDTDGDGIPDYIEIRLGTNPNVADLTDSDNDGISNYKEGYNYTNPSASLDTDRDGIPDYLDVDSDGDGILDVNDAFPINRLEWTDTDHDGIGNNVDTDDDNDGILDACDVDSNGDGIPDNGTDLDGDGVIDSCDPDMDGDGVNNTSDNCPNTPNANQADRDHDGKGDACDTIELDTAEALTPNGDGINDTWVIYNLENHPHSTVRVFSANGIQVFYSANYQNNWTGNYQGSSEMLPVGSYMFQIDLGGDGTIDSQGWMYITK
jgi:gliding motility-associated-like protein